MSYRLRLLAYSSAVSTYVLMIIGSYVSSSGSGDACPDWPLCNGQIIPRLTGPVLIEYTHRLFALLVGVLVTVMLLTVWLKFRSEKSVVVLSAMSFILLMAQILLGMVTVRTGLSPPVVAAHLGLASAVFGTLLINAVAVRRISQSETQLAR